MSIWSSVPQDSLPAGALDLPTYPPDALSCVLGHRFSSEEDCVLPEGYDHFLCRQCVEELKTAAPTRIRRRREKDWRMPDGAVYVGRGSHLGNPFQVYQHCTGRDGDWGVKDTGRLHAPLSHGWTKRGAHLTAVKAYESILDEIYPPESSARYALVHELKGKDLVCWCAPDEPCHADLLLAIANGGAS